MVKGEEKGVAIVDAAGEVKDAGRAGMEGGVVEEEGPVLVDADVMWEQSVLGRKCWVQEQTLILQRQLRWYRYSPWHWRTRRSNRTDVESAEECLTNTAVGCVG